MGRGGTRVDACSLGRFGASCSPCCPAGGGQPAVAAAQPRCMSPALGCVPSLHQQTWRDDSAPRLPPAVPDLHILLTLHLISSLVFPWPDLEIIVLLDGIDESTSRAIEVGNGTGASRYFFQPLLGASRLAPPAKRRAPCRAAPRDADGTHGAPLHSPACPPKPKPNPLRACCPPAGPQARHSYVPSDIRWQHHFDPCIQRRWVLGH